MMQTLKTELEEAVVGFSQWSNCLVPDPVFDLTGRVSSLSHLSEIPRDLGIWG